MSDGALADLRVIELAHERTSFAGKLLADMGADVIVVERPGGDPTRRYPPFVDDEPHPERSLHWWHYNTSKRGVTLDVDSERGQALFRQLARGADVVLEGEDPGRMAALGLDYPDLVKERHDLVMISITPFGRSGPRCDEAATDLTLLAGGGPAWNNGYDDHSIPPVRGGGNQAFHTGAHYAVMSGLVALLVRHETDAGQHVDVNIHASLNVTTEAGSYEWLVAQATVQRQTGRHAGVRPSSPSQIRCADGRHVNTGVPPRTPAEFKRMHEWVGELDLLEEFPEAIFLEMGGNRESIDLSKIGSDDEVTAIFAAGRDAANLIASRLSAYDFFVGSQQRGLPVGVIYAPEEVLEDPHFVARGFPVSVEHPELGRSYTYPGAPYVFQKGAWAISRRAPLIGEHNAEVFGELGVDVDGLAKLRGEGVV